jgi:hypothetical protein
MRTVEPKQQVRFLRKRSIKGAGAGDTITISAVTRTEFLIGVIEEEPVNTLKGGFGAARDKPAVLVA